MLDVNSRLQGSLPSCCSALSVQPESEGQSSKAIGVSSIGSGHCQWTPGNKMQQRQLWDGLNIPKGQWPQLVLGFVTQFQLAWSFGNLSITHCRMTLAARTHTLARVVGKVQNQIMRSLSPVTTSSPMTPRRRKVDDEGTLFSCDNA